MSLNLLLYLFICLHEDPAIGGGGGPPFFLILLYTHFGSCIIQTRKILLNASLFLLFLLGDWLFVAFESAIPVLS